MAVGGRQLAVMTLDTDVPSEPLCNVYTLLVASEEDIARQIAEVHLRARPAEDDDALAWALDAHFLLESALTSRHPALPVPRRDALVVPQQPRTTAGRGGTVDDAAAAAAVSGDVWSSYAPYPALDDGVCALGAPTPGGAGAGAARSGVVSYAAASTRGGRALSGAGGGPGSTMSAAAAAAARGARRGNGGVGRRGSNTGGAMTTSGHIRRLSSPPSPGSRRSSRHRFGSTGSGAPQSPQPIDAALELAARLEAENLVNLICDSAGEVATRLVAAGDLLASVDYYTMSRFPPDSVVNALENAGRNLGGKIGQTSVPFFKKKLIFEHIDA
jgi:hypothetical protein